MLDPNGAVAVGNVVELISAITGPGQPNGSNAVVLGSVPATGTAPPSDGEEDSVCADIDRWACSSLEGEESTSQQDSVSRVRELEEQQERLSESVLQLSTQFAQIQFRVQQIAQAPQEQRDEMIRQLQEFSSRSCPELGPVKACLLHKQEDGAKAEQVRQLINELRSQLAELEQFAWQNGQLGEGQLPLSEQQERQRLLLERLREKMLVRLELEEGGRDGEQFKRRLEECMEQALNPLREKDELVAQLRTQIVDLERYVQLLQKEAAAVACSPSPHFTSADSPTKRPLTSPSDEQDGVDHQVPLEFRRQLDYPSPNGLSTRPQQILNGEMGWLAKVFGYGSAKGKRVAAQRFERNELKNTPVGNHYGDQRAEMELAVDELVTLLKKNQILVVERPERADMSVDELNQCILEGGQEAIVSSVRKRFCPALRSLLEHGMRPVVAPTPRQGSSLLLSTIGCFPDKTRQVNNRHLRCELGKFDGRKLVHIWDVLTLFLEASRALEMRDAVVGQLSDAFKLDTVSGKSATSKQILLSTIEYINSSHGKLRRSPDTMWKAFVCAALNRSRLPAWIRIIFRSDMVLTRCYFTWSYVARTGVEDIRPLLESLHESNFDLPVDLAVRPFEHIKEAFG